MAFSAYLHECQIQLINICLFPPERRLVRRDLDRDADDEVANTLNKAMKFGGGAGEALGQGQTLSLTFRERLPLCGDQLLQDLQTNVLQEVA